MINGFDKTKNKIRCSHCEIFDSEQRICVLKQTRVSPNKKKYCSNFLLDESKIRAKTKIPTQRVESHHIKKSDLQKKAKEAEIERIKQEAMNVGVAKDENYPLTGDLSRFKTTGTDDE